MSADGRAVRAVGNPVRVAGLRRILRATPVAAALAVWTIAIVAIVAAVLVQHTGADRPFHIPDVRPEVVGQAVAQWWIVAQVVGIMILTPVVTAMTVAGPGEQALTTTWRSSLVTDRQIVRGTLVTQVSFVVLAIVVVMPVAGLAWALGGTSLAQLAVGEAAVLTTGIVVASLSIAVCGTARRVTGALMVSLVLVTLVAGGTVVFHGVRADRSGRADPVMMANPLVGAADVVAPRAPARQGATAAQAPLEHLRSTVQPAGDGLPPWARTLIGGAAIAVVSWGVSLVRLRRTARRA